MYEAVVKYVIENVPQSEKIYVGRRHHGCADGGDLIFYFLASPTAATRNHVLQARLTATAPVQRQMIRDLNSHRVRYVVLSDGHGGIGTPRASGEGGRLLDHFIQKEFEQVLRFHNYTIWKRKQR